MDSVEVLVATMNQRDFSKVQQMNIKTNCIFANQADYTNFDVRTVENGCSVKMITTTTRGVGINRNMALMYASGDILLIADDDVTYRDDYENTIEEAFESRPSVDGFIFNIETKGMPVQRRTNNKVKRVRFYNSLNYGAVRIAVKRSSLLKSNVTFNRNFGGGTQYSAGEDTLFICDMLKAGLVLYTYPKVIAEVDQTESTWFRGYTKRYFYDKGALFAAVSSKFALLLGIQDLIRHKGRYSESELKMKEMLDLIKQGIKGFRDLKPYLES